MAAQAVPYVGNPRNWPAPVMDRMPPALPRPRKGVSNFCEIARFHITAPDHCAMQGLRETWRRVEERQTFDRVPTGSGPRGLATPDEASDSPAPEQRMAQHPIVGTRCVVKDRVIFSARGHSGKRYGEPLYRPMIGDRIRGSAGRHC